MSAKRTVEHDDEDDDALTASERAQRSVTVSRLQKRQRDMEMSRNCPYLDTVKRSYLDFDFEKVCSVSLSNQNVYACLVCGKYFQGRGPASYAHLHSIHEAHHVYINLSTLKLYCLPDDYEILDSSLDDIKYLVRPTFMHNEISNLDTAASESHDLAGKPYLPGFIGMNNVKANDYLNVVVQALAHVPRFRDYFMDENNYVNHKTPLVSAFGEAVRKLWSPRLFKGQMSPHEFIQAVSTTSNKRFTSSQQSDPLEFLSWLLNQMHQDLGGTNKPNSSIVYECFQGEVEVTTSKLEIINLDGIDGQPETALSSEPSVTTQTSFLLLTLEVPPPPLFKDEMDRNIIPQVPLTTLLNKFDGRSVHVDTRKGVQRTYRLKRLPPYLIFLIKRFTRNNWDLEKNPTVINFPIKNIDLSDYATNLTVSNRYDLLTNVIHEGPPGPGKGVYKIQMVHKGTGRWWQIQDLYREEKTAQMIFLSESYLQFWEQQKLTTQQSQQQQEHSSSVSISAPAALRVPPGQSATQQQQ